MDHVLFPSIGIHEVIFGRTFVDLGVAPYLEFAIFADMEHVFEHIKITEFFEKNLKSFEGDSVEMEAITEGYVINFTEIGFGGFIVNIAPIILTATLDSSFLTG